MFPHYRLFATTSRFSVVRSNSAILSLSFKIASVVLLWPRMLQWLGSNLFNALDRVTVSPFFDAEAL